AFPLAVTLAAGVVLALTPGVVDHKLALMMFCAGAFVVATVTQEFVRGTRARRAMTSEAPPVALLSLVRRNRRRYGGYVVHAGVAVALIGVAASTSFQHSVTATIKPGQSASVDGYTVRYVRPTASATPEKIALGAVLAVSSGGRHVATLHTTYGLYPSQDPLHPIGRFFDGSTESQVGLKAGLTQDIWTVINRNVAPLQGLINQGDARFARFLNDALVMAPGPRARALSELYQLRDAAIRGLAQRFISHPWPSTFLLIVSPLVSWLWAGAIIAALGGLLALWPLPPPRRRRLPTPPATDGGDGMASPQDTRARELV
ncbi:MAG: heme lyase CcmF/NrfE family subunit, partial [Actinomycetota bacterium]|nr:heme lyase CcmF/NrfE family subunit [Actinomycetota bacterium]